MTDRTTKALLLAIALGVWANIASEWLLWSGTRPAIHNIWNELSRITWGTCINSRICDGPDHP